MKVRFIKYLMLGVAVTSMGYGLTALAQDYGAGVARTQAGLPDKIAGQRTIPGAIGKLVTYGLSIIGIVFFILIMYAGFLWMSAMGNTEKTESAQQIVEAAIIGLVLVLGAYAITSFVFTGLTTGNASTPSSGGEPIDPYQFVECKVGNDGASCNDSGGTQCVGGKCMKTCAQAFPEKNAICEVKEKCARITEAGYCPGDTTICCHD